MYLYNPTLPVIVFGILLFYQVKRNNIECNIEKYNWLPKKKKKIINILRVYATLFVIL